MAQPVFYDPGKARWKRLRLAFDVIGVSITLLVIFFAYTALRNEPLPDLLLPPQKRPYHALKEKERERAKERRKLAYLRGHRKSRGAPSQVKLNAEEGIRAAFYVPYDAASFSSLREYARQIDLLFPDWLHTITPDGRLQSIDEQTNKFFDVMQDSSVRSVDDKVMPFLKSEETGMEVFPMVNNFDGTDWVDVSAFLNNPDARASFRRQVASFLATDRYRGLMIDFETLAQNAQPGYLALLKELSDDLHARGMKLYVSVQARNQEYDYAAVAAQVDGVVLMNYDEHYPSPGTAGPVASQDWFTDNLKAAIKVVPKDKLISAIGNYGYDWVHKPKRGALPPGVKDINVTVQDAWLAARDSEADVDFDGDSLNPHISYLDEHDLQHDIWFLDAVTALNQMRAAQSLGIQTFALWRLGSEDRSLWRVWDIPGEAGAENKLKDVPPGQDVDMEGNGEILRIEARPADGQRSITLDSNTGIITDQSFDSLPEPYRVARYGSSPDKVAITFDDGPDPEWTPKILDVLKRAQAPAAFFLIGIQADKFSDITDRIYREGHEIGNHTFTHPDISNISKGFMRAVELNLTEQLFASRLGIRTILFRPPYSIDAEPDTEDQVRPLETTQDMGYITIGDKIDPNDWRDNPRHSADQIVGRRRWPISRPAPRATFAAATSSCCTMAEAIANRPCWLSPELSPACGKRDCRSFRFTIAGPDPGGGDAAHSFQSALDRAPEPVWLRALSPGLQRHDLDFLCGRRADDRAPALHRRFRHLRPALAPALWNSRRCGPLSSSGCGVGPRLQRGKSHRADHSFRTYLGLSQSARHRD